MTSDDFSNSTAQPKPKSKLGFYLLLAAWIGAWALVFAQILAPVS